jgi:hypothetical protein
VETRLFLAAAGGQAAETTVRELLREGVRWSDPGGVLEIAVREGAGAQFSRRIRNVGGVVIDHAGLETLRALERAAEFRMRFLEQRLGEAVAALAQARVPVLLVGGAALGRTSYAAFADIQMDDIDLVVPRDRAAAAASALAAGGWRMNGGSALVDTRAPVLAIELRLHTDLLPEAANPFAWSAADVWSRADRPARPLHDAVVPTRIDRIVHCCIDFGWRRMFRRRAWRAFRDLAVMLDEGPLDWPSLVHAAQRTRTASLCYWSLRLASDLCDLAVPAAVLGELRGGAEPGERLARYLAGHLVPSEPRRRPGWIERLWWSAAVRPGRSGHGRIRPWG